MLQCILLLCSGRFNSVTSKIGRLMFSTKIHSPSLALAGARSHSTAKIVTVGRDRIVAPPVIAIVFIVVSLLIGIHLCQRNVNIHFLIFRGISPVTLVIILLVHG